MTKLAHYDTTGAILGFYDPDLHSDIPEPTVEISEADWLAHVSGRAKEVQAGRIIEQRPSLDEARAQALARMRDWIGEFTARFTAGVPSAELASWPVKAQAARAHLATGIAQPLIEAEAALTGETPDDLAQRIAAKASAYEAIIARVTGLRRVTEAAISAAETPEAAAAALTAALETANQLIADLGLGPSK